MKTVVLFFEKGAPTRKVWFYQLEPGRNLGKTNPLNDDDLAEFMKLQKTFADSPKSWSVDAKSIDQSDFRPLRQKSERWRGNRAPQPERNHGRNCCAGRRERGSTWEYQGAAMNATWKDRRLGDILQLEYGKPLDDRYRKLDGLYPVYGANGEKDRSDKFYFSRPSIIVGRKGSAGEINLTERKVLASRCHLLCQVRRAAARFAVSYTIY